MFPSQSQRAGPMRGPVPLLLALMLGCGVAGENTADAPPGTPPQERSNAPQQDAAPAMGTAWVIFGADTVRAEVAKTAEERARGLMYREEVPDGTGMIFVYTTSDIHSFWMQNTFVALDIAFMDPDLKVVDIQQMEPQTEDLHQSRAPAMYVLEVPKGWFAAHSVEVGDRAEVVFGL